MRPTLLPLLMASLAGCAAPHSASPPAVTTSPGARESLPFIEDDYPRALAEAKQRGLPLFVDVWAPW